MQQEEILEKKTEKLYSFKELAILTGANTEFLTSLANIFVTTTVANSAELLEAAELNDWQKVSKLAHKIKPTIDNIHIESIKRDIRLLEADAKNEINIPVLLTTAVKVNKTICAVALQIKEEFNL